MVIKVYVSGISGNKEVKKRQQRVLLILDSKNVNYEVIDIAEPGSENEKDFMQTNATSLGRTISDPSPRHPLPPQIFNDEIYCGDYDQFDMANEIDEMEDFLRLQVADATDNLISNAQIKLLKNGELAPDKIDEHETTESEVKENSIEPQATSGEKSIEKEIKIKEFTEPSEKSEADEDSSEDEPKAAAESKELKDDDGEQGEAGGKQNEEDDAVAKVTVNDEEKADA